VANIVIHTEAEPAAAAGDLVVWLRLNRCWHIQETDRRRNRCAVATSRSAPRRLQLDSLTTNERYVGRPLEVGIGHVELVPVDACPCGRRASSSVMFCPRYNPFLCWKGALIYQQTNQLLGRMYSLKWRASRARRLTLVLIRTQTSTFSVDPRAWDVGRYTGWAKKTARLLFRNILCYNVYE